MMRVGKFIFVVLLSVVFLSPEAAADTFTIDASHSTVAFRIRHLLSYVRGNFGEFEGKFVYDPEKPETWTAEAVIQVGSIDTNVKERDDHLRGEDFFGAEKFPTMTFKSTKMSEVTATSARLHGLLTMHGVEKEVALDLEIHGVGKDPWGNVRSGFTATTMINRKEFGLAWNKTLETGQLLVGEEVEVTLEIEGVLAKE